MTHMRAHALDYLACQIYHNKCRSDGIKPLPWWHVSAEARDGFRKLAGEKVDEWCDREERVL